jgi:hypothetical protein
MTELINRVSSIVRPLVERSEMPLFQRLLTDLRRPRPNLPLELEIHTFHSREFDQI